MTEKEKQMLYQSMQNDFNCGTFILTPNYVEKLIEKENKTLKEKNNQLARKCECLTKCNDGLQDLLSNDIDTLEQLIKAKQIIKNIIRVTWSEGWNYSLDWKVKAEQFIKEN